MSGTEHTVLVSPGLGDHVQIIICSSIQLPADFIIIFSWAIPHCTTFLPSISQLGDIRIYWQPFSVIQNLIFVLYICVYKTKPPNVLFRGRTHRQQKKSLHLSLGSCHFWSSLVIKDKPLICLTLIPRCEGWMTTAQLTRQLTKQGAWKS